MFDSTVVELAFDKRALLTVKSCLSCATKCLSCHSGRRTKIWAAVDSEALIAVVVFAVVDIVVVWRMHPAAEWGKPAESAALTGSEKCEFPVESVAEVVSIPAVAFASRTLSLLPAPVLSAV